MTDPVPYFEKIKQKLTDENLRKEFSNFNRDILFDFTDIEKQYTLRFSGGTVEIIAGKVEKPHAEITTTSDVIAGIIDKKTNPVVAYVSRKIKVKGEMQDLLKLQKLM